MQSKIVRNKIIREFNKKLQKIKTPKQVDSFLRKEIDDRLSTFGTVAFAYMYPKGVIKMGKIFKEDKYYNIFNKKGHRISKMEKKTALLLFKTLELTAGNIVNKLSKVFE